MSLLRGFGTFSSFLPSSSSKREGLAVGGDVWLSQTHCTSPTRPPIEGRIVLATQTVTLPVLIDSGADGNFLDRGIVKKWGIRTQPLEQPVEAKALNGQVLAQIVEQTVPVNLHLSGNHKEIITFFVFDCVHIPLVLGLPWLKLHCPHIDWSVGQVLSWSSFCHSHCLQSALPPVFSRSAPVPESPDLSSVPPCYHDLGPVFSKPQALSLAPHRPYDCAIDLLPGATLPSSRLYNLLRPETEAMEKYIQ